MQREHRVKKHEGNHFQGAFYINITQVNRQFLEPLILTPNSHPNRKESLPPEDRGRSFYFVKAFLFFFWRDVNKKEQQCK